MDYFNSSRANSEIMNLSQSLQRLTKTMLPAALGSGGQKYSFDQQLAHQQGRQCFLERLLTAPSRLTSLESRDGLLQMFEIKLIPSIKSLRACNYCRITTRLSSVTNALEGIDRCFSCDLVARMISLSSAVPSAQWLALREFNWVVSMGESQ
jgi:hypothetical protein